MDNEEERVSRWDPADHLPDVQSKIDYLDAAIESGSFKTLLAAWWDIIRAMFKSGRPGEH